MGTVRAGKTICKNKASKFPPAVLLAGPPSSVLLPVDFRRFRLLRIDGVPEDDNSSPELLTGAFSTLRRTASLLICAPGIRR
jgi:hypothetical protein